ncbi:hypothetical protein BKA70DRAFT_1097118 [Coprinopsis sp. MPI-PUGE-AT-0042]|nr:hypothetical protein BKA70DRAFT_1097118 [Coprinopsis sp. MPI-PUGE-AT-0042]
MNRLRPDPVHTLSPPPMAPTLQRPNDPSMRREYLDSLRAALVLLLIVDYAVTRTMEKTGWPAQPPFTSSNSESLLAVTVLAIAAAAKTFVIPALFLISGYSSVLSYEARQSIAGFVKSKTLRLLLPSLVAYLLPALLPSFSPGHFPSFQTFPHSLPSLLSQEAPYLLRLYTFDLGYGLVLLIQKHSFIEFPLRIPAKVFGVACWAFAAASTRAMGGSTYWLPLPAYIAGINYLPGAHQYFMQSPLPRLPAAYRSAIPQTKFNPKSQAKISFVTSTFLSLSFLLLLQYTYHDPSASQHPLQFLSQAAIGSMEGSTWALGYAIWASTSFVALSTSIVFLFGTHVRTSIETTWESHLDMLHQKPVSKMARRWLAHAVTRYVYLQAYGGCLVVDAFLLLRLPEPPHDAFSATALVKQVASASAVAIFSAWGVMLLLVLCTQAIQMVSASKR